MRAKPELVVPLHRSTRLPWASLALMAVFSGGAVTAVAPMLIAAGRWDGLVIFVFIFC